MSFGIREGIAILGIIILAIGVFLPTHKIENSRADDPTFFDQDESDDMPADGQGVTILIIGLVTVLMILMGRGEYVWIPGLLTFWLVWTNLSIDWSDIHNSDRIDLGIGWFVMLVGIVLTIASPWVEGLMTKVGQSRAQAQYPYQQPQQYQQYQQYQQQYPQQPGQQPPSDQQPPYQGPPGQS